MTGVRFSAPVTRRRWARPMPAATSSSPGSSSTSSRMVRGRSPRCGGCCDPTAVSVSMSGTIRAAVSVHARLLDRCHRARPRRRRPGRGPALSVLHARRACGARRIGRSARHALDGAGGRGRLQRLRRLLAPVHPRRRAGARLLRGTSGRGARATARPPGPDPPARGRRLDQDAPARLGDCCRAEAEADRTPLSRPAPRPSRRASCGWRRPSRRRSPRRSGNGRC